MIDEQIEKLIQCVSRIKSKLKKEKANVYEITDRIAGLNHSKIPTAEALQLMFNFRYLMKHCDDLEAELKRLMEVDCNGR